MTFRLPEEIYLHSAELPDDHVNVSQKFVEMFMDFVPAQNIDTILIVYISTTDFLSHKVITCKNRPEDDCSIVDKCSPCN